MNRRQFARTLAVTAASYRRILGANERLGVALIGSGRRGRDVAKAAVATTQADVRVICDIYRVQRERAREVLGAGEVKPYECATHEEALGRPGVDAVILATPDHLHLSLAAAAFAAGKHVYLEKPAIHKFEEGAALAEAARKANKVCQVGTQQRSGSHYKDVRDNYLTPHKLGHVVFARTAWNNFPWQARNIASAPKPDDLDWDRFLGPAPKVPYEAARYDAWRYYPDYGGGVLADIFNHWADSAQWLMGDESPLHAVALGGIYELRDGRLNPDTVNAVVQYKDWNLTFECTVLSVRDDRPGILFQGDEGSLFIARDGYLYTPYKGAPVEVKATEDLDRAHFADFVNAVHTNSRPSAAIDTALKGLLPCHMARAAYWSGKRASYDEKTNQITTS
jgi:predicted dehydrogenase